MKLPKCKQICESSLALALIPLLRISDELIIHVDPTFDQSAPDPDYDDEDVLASDVAVSVASEIKGKKHIYKHGQA